MSRIYDTSRRLVLTHTYFQWECSNRKFSSFCRTLPIPATKCAAGITTHATSAGSIILINSFHPRMLGLCGPRLKGKQLGRYLLFLSIETFSAGCYPRPRAGARAKRRWTDHWTPHYIGAVGGGPGRGWCREGFLTKPREPGALRFPAS